MDERTWIWEHHSELTDEQFAECVRAALKAAAERPSAKPDNRTREEIQEAVFRTIITAPPEKVEFIFRLARTISTMTDAELLQLKSRG